MCGASANRGFASESRKQDHEIIRLKLVFLGRTKFRMAQENVNNRKNTAYYLIIVGRGKIYQTKPNRPALAGPESCLTSDQQGNSGLTGSRRKSLILWESTAVNGKNAFSR